jgi:protein-tyrosine phosphatase
MIDIHCHYLPGVDDGPRDLASAIALARASVSNGIKVAVMTPHVYAGRWSNTLTSLVPVFDDFEVALEAEGIPLQLRLGAEAHLQPETLALFERDELPSIGTWNGRELYLLELPDGSIPPGTMKAMDFMLAHDVVPMIAHPERNKHVMQSVARMEPFVKAGCLLQITAASVCGWFGKPAHVAALELLDRGWVTAVATDAHNLLHRPPVLAEARHAIRMRYGDQAATRLTESNPALIVG